MDASEETPVGDSHERAPESAARLVDVMFAVVVAQSFMSYSDVIVRPLSFGNWLGALALLLAYVAGIAMWVDWRLRPEMACDSGDTTSGASASLLGGLVADVGVVLAYAFVLFTVSAFVGQPDSPEVWRFVLGWLLLLALLTLKEVVAIGRRAWASQNHTALAVRAAGLAALLVVYVLVRDQWAMDLDTGFRYLNALVVVASVVLFDLDRVRLSVRRALAR
jgi:hypothetical protein